MPPRSQHCDGKSKDQDEDGIEDKKDNCVFDENPEQEDMDADGLGDICDSDLDGDGLPNDSDCEAADAEIFPGNPEKCNGFDDNCDGSIDDPDKDTRPLSLAPGILREVFRFDWLDRSRNDSASAEK